MAWPGRAVHLQAIPGPRTKVVSLQKVSGLGNALESQSETLLTKVDELEQLRFTGLTFRIVEDTCEAIACVNEEELLVEIGIIGLGEGGGFAEGRGIRSDSTSNTNR